MTTVAVVGPGAIGSTVAAWLAQDARLTVTVCARTPRSGLAIDTPAGRIEAAVPVVTDPRSVGPVDWVLLSVKAYDVAGAAGWLQALIGAGTRVAVLQNGVEQADRVRPYAPEASVVPVVVDIPAERMPDGTVRQSRDGTLIVPSGPDGDAFVDLFAASPIAASTTDDFVTTAWSKLCLNAAGAICAVLRQPSGVAHQEAVAELIRGVVAETVAVGRAQGAVLDDDLPDVVVRRMQDNPSLFVNSLAADRIAGRRTEVQARNGAVVRGGAVHGVPTPLNAMLTTLIEAEPVPGFGDG